jgi:hypothetical protein
MAAGEDEAQRDHAGDAGLGQEYRYGWGLALDTRSLLHGRRAAPSWMRAELVRLQAAFPEFSFGICPGWRGPMFEVWRQAGAGGLYAVISHDAGELWRELEAARSAPKPVAGPAVSERP